MKINKNLIIIAAVIAVFCTAGCASQETRTASNKYSSIESAYFGKTVPVAVKDFEVKGVVFLNSKVVYDLETGDKNGSEITSVQLMQEAVKLGADDIINVRIDKTEIKEAEDYYNKNTINDKEVFAGRKYLEKKIIYNATALAIKYTNAILYPGAEIAEPKQTKNITDEQQIKTVEQEDAQAVSAATVNTQPVSKTKKKGTKGKPRSVFSGLSGN